MSTGGAVAPTISYDTSWRPFVRHFLEMVAAMIVGMAVLGAIIRLILLPLLGFSYAELADQTELRALVMATNMVIGMSLWMRHRGHGWASVGEMAAAMYLPFIVLFVPFWAGLLSGRAVVSLGHLLMLPFMVVAMLYRRDEYAQDHRRAHASTRAIPARREDSEMATVSAFTDNNLNGQGFECLSQEAKSRYALPLRFTPAVGTILVVIGLVRQSPIWLGSLALVALSGALFPRHMFIDLIYNLGVRHLFRAPPLPPTPKPRRFSYLISTSSLAGAALSFYYGLPVLGFILGGVVVIGATILAITLWCLGSWIYRIIFVPAAAKLGWNPM